MGPGGESESVIWVSFRAGRGGLRTLGRCPGWMGSETRTVPFPTRLSGHGGDTLLPVGLLRGSGVRQV